MNLSHAERPQLRQLLTECRANVDLNGAFLGSKARHPRRVGKRVTQEDAALERGRQVRVSPVVLSRIADTLAMTAEERRILFTLAVPELTQVFG